MQRIVLALVFVAGTLLGFGINTYSPNLREASPAATNNSVPTPVENNSKAVGPTSYLDRAIDFVKVESEWLARTSDHTKAKFRYFAALSALTYVQTNLSSSRHNYYKNNDKGFPKKKDTETCLRLQVGVCGNHIEAFIAILVALDVPVRPVQIYYYDSSEKRQAHIVAEVKWDGKWHLFDVTWGFIPKTETGEVLSFSEVRTGAPHIPYLNKLNPWYQYANTAYDVLQYIWAKDADIVVGGFGTIRPYLTGSNDDIANYGLAHIPNYIGRAPTLTRETGNIVYEIDIPEKFNALNLNIKATACPGGQLTDGNISKPIKKGKVTFPVTSELMRLTVTSERDTCYAVLDSIMATIAPM